MSLTPITGGVTLKERRPIPGSLTVLATGPTNYEKNGTLTSYKQGPIQTERFEAKNKNLKRTVQTGQSEKRAYGGHRSYERPVD